MADFMVQEIENKLCVGNGGEQKKFSINATTSTTVKDCLKDEQHFVRNLSIVPKRPCLITALLNPFDIVTSKRNDADLNQLDVDFDGTLSSLRPDKFDRIHWSKDLSGS